VLIREICKIVFNQKREKRGKRDLIIFYLLSALLGVLFVFVLFAFGLFRVAVSCVSPDPQLSFLF
jgi:predicted nucleic acid-binding Zn ribbon protein